MMPQHAATNVMRVGATLLVAQGCAALPHMQKLARAAGVAVSHHETRRTSVTEGSHEELITEYENLVEIPNSEFAKADGALTCRSLLLELHKEK
mmetsp:Transcript_21810/g.32009  ORF Transcript_21810/g.32009 Transcript_21810/m.32009 type:complete len:94 (+) Transcript_21810:3-284(+)